MLKRAARVIVLVAVMLLAAHLIWRPPSLEGRTVSQAVAASADTALGRFAIDEPAAHDGESGVLPLLDGLDAFAARVALIRAAETGLDVQYYIWQRDTTGLILLDELRKAAGRGVRVRLLLDDNGISGLDGDLAALAAVPGIEVRLFNPFILRHPKALGFAFDFMRLNRRMHNKSMTADGAASILGGRNIGDVYFSFGDGPRYNDTDVLVVGPVAADIGADFDRYWQSASAHPAERILGAARQDALDRLARDAAQAAAAPAGAAYFEQLRTAPLVVRMLAGEVAFEWTGVTLFSDDPAKGLGQARERDLLYPQLMALLARPGRSVDLVSAYFIPGQYFTDRLRALAGGGVRVRILTNSQAATDVFLVHGSYAHYRPQLLAAGVALYELRPGYAADDEAEARGLAGSSHASLHSKTLAVDGERVFIGSFNFDPRSLFLNTEMGVLIESPRMARGLAEAFAGPFPAMSYQPALGDDGRVHWDETLPGGKTLRHAVEPGTSALSRVFLQVIGLLPLEWLL